MKTNLLNSVWYTITISIIVFAMTIINTIQGAPAWGWAIAITLFLLQVFGLVYYLHRDPAKQEKGMLKAFLFLLKLSALGVIFWLCLATYALASQYHNLIVPTENGDNTNITIVQDGELYIMYPKYKTVEFVTKDRPSRGDESITYCSGATFQKTYNLIFDPEELCGINVEKGNLNKGYRQNNLGAFTFYDGRYHFASPEEAELELERAAERGGWGFQQFVVIDNGVIDSALANEYRCYRVIAELNGKLCIIDSRKQIKFKDFTEELVRVGVKEALYMDMGSGWNYSWYRDNNGKVNVLIGLPWPFSHNWLTFKK